MNEAYTAAGVNIELGDELSDALYEAAKQTRDNRQFQFGELEELSSGFSGARVLPVASLRSPKDTLLYMSDDGVGTKVEVAERLKDHSGVAFDLFAMVCDDAVVRGAEPIAITTTLDVRKLEDTDEARAAITGLARGYVAAAREAEVVVVNGEVAELGNRVGGYGDFNYNWAATVLWAAHRDRILDNTRVRSGDQLVAFREDGFRSNGLSLVRKILTEVLGEDWHEDGGDGSFWGEAVRQPSRIYTPAVTTMTGGYDDRSRPTVDTHGIAHITGGGLPGKLGRMLVTNGLGAIIDNPFKATGAMKTLQALGRVSDRDAYSTWNMGQGMVVATPESSGAIEVASWFGIEAKIIGSVTEKPGIHIVSQGQEAPESVLSYDV